MVTYRLAVENDYIKINDFYNRIYQAKRTIEQFYWEFHDGPFGQSIYVIAEDGDKVIGTNCVIPIELICANKQIIRSGKSEDTLVDPAYRGQKIFYKIYEFLFEKCREANIKVIWGFTSAKKPFENLGFEIPYNHEQSLAVNNVAKSYAFLSSLNTHNKALDKIKILGLCMLSKVKALGKFKPLSLSYRVEENNEVVEGVAELISKNQTASNSIFAIHQTASFQQWRVYGNPNYHQVHTYSFYNDNNELMALILFNSHANKVAYICQTTFHPSLEISEKVKIVQHATAKLFDSGIALVRNWTFNTNEVNIQEAHIQEKAGYKPLKRGIGLVWKTLDEIDVKPQDFYLTRIATQGTI